MSGRNDFARRRKHYISDWTDARQNIQQCIPSILFLYFSCLAPVVSFGTIASQITEGSIGVVEFLIGSGGAGMVSCLSLGGFGVLYHVVSTQSNQQMNINNVVGILNP